MKRYFINNLKNWKNSSYRKPLIVQGARQVGKTYIIKEFGERYYENTIYLNFEQEKELNDLFSHSLKPEKIINTLSTYFNEQIQPGKTLVIFDEIQESSNALVSLKYFHEEANEFHIIAAGSLLGIKLKDSKTFPVGKVNFFTMFPMTFFEFLDALNEENLRKFIIEHPHQSPFPKLIRTKLHELLRTYLYIGGMPEVVKNYLVNNDFEICRQTQKDIIRSYSLDFAKHASSADAVKIGHIWDIIPTQLAKENKKFIFSAIQKSARARGYENALQWLIDAGIVLKATCVNTPQIPLKGVAKSNIFKIYYLDVGLLGASVNLSPKTIFQNNELFSSFKCALTENYVAQSLISQNTENLYYWTSGNTAEVDFLLEDNNEIIPLEVKSGFNTKAKSLIEYNKKYSPKIAVRTSLKEQQVNENTYDCPLFAIQRLISTLEKTK